MIDSALQILQAASQASGEFELEIEHLPWGTAYYKATGSYLPADRLSTLARSHAILFGAVGAPDVPDEVSFVGTTAGPSRINATVCQCPPGQVLREALGEECQTSGFRLGLCT